MSHNTILNLGTGTCNYILLFTFPSNKITSDKGTIARSEPLIRVLALVVLKSHIAIFSTTNNKNRVTLVELLLNFLAIKLQ